MSFFHQGRQDCTSWIHSLSLALMQKELIPFSSRLRSTDWSPNNIPFKSTLKHLLPKVNYYRSPKYPILQSPSMAGILFWAKFSAAVKLDWIYPSRVVWSYFNYTIIITISYFYYTIVILSSTAHRFRHQNLGVYMQAKFLLQSTEI